MEFYKLQASGNDFILLDSLKAKTGRNTAFYRKFAKKYCLRKSGIGADGLLVIASSPRADFRMRIFNADGSEAEMCGNGARSAGLWAFRSGRKQVSFETKAGIIHAQLRGKSISDSPGLSHRVKIKASAPFGLKSDLPLKVFGRKLKVNFINTGVPHTVIFVEKSAEIAVDKIGREIRFHKQFKPAGTNVDFVEIKGKNSLSVRTYERGVEAETLACGTGIIASAIISWLKLNPGSMTKKPVSLSVKARSNDVLKVTFTPGENISDVWMEGGVSLVYRGEVRKA
jgi:diaminopimelate epimerase